MERLECIDSDALMQKIRDQAADRPDPGDASINICFATTHALLSRTIRWFTGSLVSHALITFRDRTLNRIMVMQASGHGYQIVPWARWETHNILVARFELPDTVEEKCQLYALRALARRIGDGYDTRGLFGFLPLLWYKLVAKWRVRRQGRGGGELMEPWRPRFHNWLDNPAKLFCSEAVAEYLGLADRDWDTEYFQRPQDWSPENLLGFAQDNLIEIRDQDQEVTRRLQEELGPRYWARYEKRFRRLKRPSHLH